jgi:hypothetical protein
VKQELKSLTEANESMKKIIEDNKKFISELKMELENKERSIIEQVILTILL